jgi:hypothetical protein
MIYLDLLDSYYTINHEPEPKEKTKTNMNDEKIGIISLILIVAFAIYIIGTIIHAYAYGVCYLIISCKNIIKIFLIKFLMGGMNSSTNAHKGPSHQYR